jgi:MSHA biogenesis protein MshP
MAIQQTRAYQVARAGLEYGIARVLADATCSDFTLDGFAVLMNCPPPSSVLLEEEGNITPSFHTIEATATFATPTSPDYAYRKLTAVVEKP